MKTCFPIPCQRLYMMVSLSVMLGVMLVVPALAQNPALALDSGGTDADEAIVQAPDDEAPTKEAPGFGLSQRFLDLMIRRWALDVSERHDLDEPQRQQVEGAMVKRWSGFIRDHRDDLQPLINEYMEMRWALEPPEKETVSEWATRAEPMFELLRDEIDDGIDDFRGVLRPAQRIRFEAEAMAFRAGVEWANQRLGAWQRGDYEQREFWQPTRAERRKLREQKRREEAEAASAKANAPDQPKTGGVPDDQIALELAAWDAYVAEFIEVHALDESQRVTARSCLAELRGRAIDHRDRRKEEINALEMRIAGQAESDDDVARLKEELTQLYGPIDDMFAELKGRIDRIPTAQQREYAANARTARDSAAKNRKKTDAPARPSTAPASKAEPTTNPMPAHAPAKKKPE